jgi:hypothetical protein
MAGLACSSSGGSEGAGQSSSIEDEDYPNLSRVPGEQPRPTPASLRDELIAGLAADRANARYSDEALTGTSAAAPPAAPPPAAGTQVEIIWETLRVEPEATASEKAADGAAVSGAGAAATGSGAAATGAAAGASVTAGEGEQEEVEIDWETERVEPSGKVATAGGAAVEEELILAPGPELVGVVYFANDSAQVESSDLELLEDVVALYKERGGHQPGPLAPACERRRDVPLGSRCREGQADDRSQGGQRAGRRPRQYPSGRRRREQQPKGRNFPRPLASSSCAAARRRGLTALWGTLASLPG